MTPITQMIFINQGMLLLGSNHFLLIIIIITLGMMMMIIITIINIVVGLIPHSRIDVHPQIVTKILNSK